MTITSREEVHISIDPDKIVQVEKVTVFEDNGVEIGRSQPWRGSAEPGMDTSALPEAAKKVVASLWTKEVVAEYTAKQEAKQEARAAELTAAETKLEK